MNAYFDTNVFDHLYKKTGCTSADIALLRKAVYGRALSIRLSIHTLEEILLNRRASPQELVARIKLTLSLANMRRMIKPCNQLIEDDIRAYAVTGQAAHPILDASAQNVISEGLGELIESDGENLEEEFRAPLEEARRQRESFRDNLSAALEGDEPSLRVLRQRGVTFTEVWESRRLHDAEALARRAGVRDQCIARGLEGLLEIKSIRASVGIACSYIYSRIFENRAVRLSDQADLLHTASAAASAEMFVTDDNALHTLLERVPLENFEVIDLPAFLTRVRASSLD